MAVRNHQVMEIQYERMKEPRLVSRRIEPVGILFSEYYFLPGDLPPGCGSGGESLKIKTISFLLFIALTGFIPSKFWGSIFMFLIKIASRKENSQAGTVHVRRKLERIRFRYTGPSIEAVLDRSPTAEIIGQDEDGWTVEAEVFGKGLRCG